MSRGTTVASAGKCVKCRNPALMGTDLCTDHIAHNQKRFRAAMYHFKGKAVQTAFEMMLNADDRLTLDNELALMRTCLDAAVSKCDVENVADMGPHSIAAITSLASEVAKVCDVMARLEQRYATHVPLEVLLFFIQLIAETVTKFTDEETAEILVGAILELPLPQSNTGSFNRGSILARGTCDPTSLNRREAKKPFKNRAAKVEALRAQAEQLRKEIEESGGSIDETDENLAPTEPDNLDGEAE